APMQHEEKAALAGAAEGDAPKTTEAAPLYLEPGPQVQSRRVTFAGLCAIVASPFDIYPNFHRRWPTIAKVVETIARTFEPWEIGQVRTFVGTKFLRRGTKPRYAIGGGQALWRAYEQSGEAVS